MEQQYSIRMFRIINKEQSHSMLNVIQIFVKSYYVWIYRYSDIETFIEGYNPFPMFN